MQPAKLMKNAGEGHYLDDTTSCIWHLPSDLTHEVLRDLLLKWECKEHLEYEFKSSVGHSLPFPTPRIRELVGNLMDGRCFGQVGQDFITNRLDKVQVLHALCQKHVCEARNVAPAHDAQMLGYKLTQLGLDSLVTFDILKSPAYFLHARPLTDSVSLADLTTYELLDHMFTAGWQVRALRYGQRKNRMGVVAYRVGRPKHWWIREGKANISWSYLRALLTVDASWPPVEHLLTDAAYDHFVDHKAWPRSSKQRRQAAIQDGLEGIEAQMAAVERPRPRPKASARRPAKRARASQDSEHWGPLQDIELYCLQDNDDNSEGEMEGDAVDDVNRDPAGNSDNDDSEGEKDGDAVDNDDGDSVDNDDINSDDDDDEKDKKQPDHHGDDASVVEDDIENEDNAPLATLLRLGRRANSPNLEADLDADSGSGNVSSQSSSSRSRSSSSSSTGDSDRGDAPRVARQAAETIVLHGETFVRLRQAGELKTLEILCPECGSSRRCSHASLELAEAARRLLIWRGCCPAHQQAGFGGPLLRRLLD